MKKMIISCVIIMVCLYSIIGFYLFFNHENIKVLKLDDLTNLNKKDIEKNYSNLNIEYIYISSLESKDEVVHTIPSKDEIIYETQLIKVYLSNGISNEKYEYLINKYYDDCLNYLEYLESIGIDVIVEKQISDEYADGLIISQSLLNVINKNDSFKIVVNYNEPLILIPDLIGKDEVYAINYFKEYAIEVCFIYEKNNGSNLIFKQSIKPNSLIKNKISILYLHIST